MPLIYLDNCALQRPLDDRSQFRVQIEAEAVEAVLRTVERGAADLVVSDVLLAESGAVLDVIRRDFAADVLARAAVAVRLTLQVRERARLYREDGMKSVDALHLASAVDGRADFFCTTDDRLLNRAKAANRAGVRVVTPPELALALNL